MRIPVKTLFGRTWLWYINALCLQFFFIRLAYCINLQAKKESSDPNWVILRWILPFTGWNNDYLYWGWWKRRERMRIWIFASVFLLCASAAYTEPHKDLEKVYQEVWCDAHNGIKEYRLDDETRVDCLTDEYAVEVEFGYKWAESIGQSLFYALKTSRKAGVVLILEQTPYKVYLDRLMLVGDKYGIKIWTMTPEDLKEKK